MSEQHFKPGDRVRCIEVDSLMSCRVGQEYAVRRMGSEGNAGDTEMVCLEGITGGKCIRRFELVSRGLSTDADEPLVAAVTQNECTCQDNPHYCEFCQKQIEALCGLKPKLTKWRSATTIADIDAIKRMSGTDGFHTPQAPKRELSERDKRLMPASENIARAIARHAEDGGIMSAYRRGREA